VRFSVKISPFITGRWATLLKQFMPVLSSLRKIASDKFDVTFKNV